MKLTKMFPGRYLKAADLDGAPLDVTIDRCVEEMVADDMKWCLYFRGESRPLVLNVTNCRAIAEITGCDDSDDWPGKRITLYPCRVPFGGKIVDAIRVREVDDDAAQTQQAFEEDAADVF